MNRRMFLASSTALALPAMPGERGILEPKPKDITAIMCAGKFRGFYAEMILESMDLSFPPSFSRDDDGFFYPIVESPEITLSGRLLAEHNHVDMSLLMRTGYLNTKVIIATVGMEHA